jgi:uncharacterized protein YkwD
MPKTILSLLTIITAVAVLAGAAAGGMSTTRSARRSGSTLSGLESRILVQLNRIRVVHGLAPLRLNRRLEVSSVQHSREMGEQGYFAHDSSDGTSFWQRITQLYAADSHASLAVGENLLWSTPNVRAAAALRAWMSSPEHRTNILAPTWREIGVGAVRFAAAPGVFGGLPVTIITTDFGARR